MIKEAILKLARNEDLSYGEAQQVMDEIMEGKANDIQMAAYLAALSMKGETIDEITASAAGMRAHCIKLLHDMDVLKSWAPAETEPIPLTFPPHQRWSSLREGCRWRSTETVPHHRSAELPTY